MENDYVWDKGNVSAFKDMNKNNYPVQLQGTEAQANGLPSCELAVHLI